MADLSPAHEPEKSALFGGEFVPGIHVFGQAVNIWVSPRTEEINRRAAVGVEAILEEYMIRVLMTIPEAVPIELRTLDAASLWAMEELLAAHAVEVVGDTVCRRAIPPVDLLGFAKVACEWSDVRGLPTGIEPAAPSRGISPVSVCWPPHQRPAPYRVLELDAGLTATPQQPDLQSSRGVCTTAASRSISQPGRRSWQRWSIAEAAYEGWLNTAASLS